MPRDVRSFRDTACGRVVGGYRDGTAARSKSQSSTTWVTGSGEAEVAGTRLESRAQTTEAEKRA
jgi:hypothetical protein